ncbi:MAG: DUF1573 domain-containing protein [Bacteroidetes bacterium]|nr:DUF1573 domain-containing protein [Bacteroidota bacterium]
MKTRRLHIISYLILFSYFTACHSTEKKNSDIPENAINSDVVNNPASASGSNDASKDNVPVFEFAEESHDFGTITQGEKISYAFRFKNKGKIDLVIRAANGSCGCTVPEWPKEPIAPGKEGVVNVTFNSEGKEGKQDKTITLIANTIPNTKVLTIMGEVIKPAN